MNKFKILLIPLLLISGCSQPDFIKSSVPLTKFLAASGNADAQFNLGYMYWSATGVPKSNKAAWKLWELAAEQGHADAQYHIGWMYDVGRSVTENHATSMKWNRLAAKQGHRAALNEFGHLYEWGMGVTENKLYAYANYSIASILGDNEAQINKNRMKRSLSEEQRAIGLLLANSCLNSDFKHCPF